MANTNPDVQRFADDIAQKIADQLATTTNAAPTEDESNTGAANGTYETTSTVNSFQVALDQYSLLKADAANGQLTFPTIQTGSLIGNTLVTGILTIAGALSANGANGGAGQLLTADGSNGVYWSTVAGAGTPNLNSVLTTGSTSNSTIGVGNATITGFANVSTTLQVSGVSTLANTQISSLGIGTAASGTAGEIRATNNITAYYSDDRFKTRLGNIENALDKIDQLTGFYYEANELAQSYGYEKIREVGVSAQDTQKVMNEIVAPAPVDERYLTVRYEKFAPLLIEGIKELRVELNKIKDHLNI